MARLKERRIREIEETKRGKGYENERKGRKEGR